MLAVAGDSAQEQADKYRQLLLGGNGAQRGRKGGKDWGAAADAAADSDDDQVTPLDHSLLQAGARPQHAVSCLSTKADDEPWEDQKERFFGRRMKGFLSMSDL